MEPLSIKEEWLGHRETNNALERVIQGKEDFVRELAWMEEQAKTSRAPCQIPGARRDRRPPKLTAATVQRGGEARGEQCLSMAHSPGGRTIPPRALRHSPRSCGI
ncbi:hypothetical protein EOD39_12407 [Acipenser ruthenus]|uniref:Uncharacterized protein n=1 Tax=Acipenser ruthenus TaxID=7906 RepID=A0A662YQV9_ACIRT|nr:hypothetical protein EOD39_12407 [Acipenser ruthenus]